MNQFVSCSTTRQLLLYYRHLAMSPSRKSVVNNVPAALGKVDDAKCLKMIVGVWRDLVQNTDALRRLVTFLNGVVREDQERSGIELADVEFATALLATKVGDGAPSLGMDSIFQILEELVKDFTALHDDVLRLDLPEFESARSRKIEEAISKDVAWHLRPFFELYKTLSRSFDAPGHLLEEQFYALEALIPVLEAQELGLGLGCLAWWQLCRPQMAVGWLLEETLNWRLT